MKSQFPRAASFFLWGVMVEVSSRGNPEEPGHGLWASPMGVPPWEHSVRDGGSPAIVQGKWKALRATGLVMAGLVMRADLCVQVQRQGGSIAPF